jgi:hypothetical protein
MKPWIHSFAGAIAAAALFSGLARAQENIEIRVSERYRLGVDRIYVRAPAANTMTHQLTLTLVTFTGGDWPRDIIVEAMRNTAKILENCGVRLVDTELLQVEAPPRYHYLDTPVSRELARTLRLAKPTVYFVTDTRHRPAFDAEAMGRGNTGTRPELADSVWITRPARDVGVTLTHELVHVLTNSGEHVDLPGNLMREDTAPKNTQLTNAQCIRLREVGVKNGLLRAVAKEM